MIDLRTFVVMPEGVDNFKQWWPTVQNTDQVYPHEQHCLSRKPSNSEKHSIREDFLNFVDENSQPNGRNTDSAGTQYYFSPKFTRIGEPTKSEKTVRRKQVIPFSVSSIGLKESRIKRGVLNVRHFGG